MSNSASRGYEEDSSHQRSTLKKRGPSTPEGKARSAMNALKHGMRGERFALLPEETVEAFEAYASSVKAAFRPGDDRELAYVEAIVVAEWRQMRADQMEADVMSDITPHSKHRMHGTNFINQPEHRTSLATVLRYRSQAQMELKRAVVMLDTYRRNKRMIPTENCADQPPTDEAPAEAEPAPAEAANENCTNELIPSQVKSPPSPPAPEPTSRGERERAAPALSQNLPDENCTNELSPTPQPAPQRPVVHRKEKVPRHHRRWW